MLQHVRLHFLRAIRSATEKARPGYENFYQTSRVPDYSLISVFGEVDAAQSSVLQR